MKLFKRTVRFTKEVRQSIASELKKASYALFGLSAVGSWMTDTLGSAFAAALTLITVGFVQLIAHIILALDDDDKPPDR